MKLIEAMVRNARALVRVMINHPSRNEARRPKTPINALSERVVVWTIHSLAMPATTRSCFTGIGSADGDIVVECPSRTGPQQADFRRN
jgi:hypothetical protein